MTRRAQAPRRRASRANTRAAFLCALLCCFIAMQREADAASLADYRARSLKAAEAMEELHRGFDETGDVNSPEFVALENRTFQEVRAALPAREKIEGAGNSFDVDNRWLHGELDLYATIAPAETGERDGARRARTPSRCFSARSRAVSSPRRNEPRPIQS